MNTSYFISLITAIFIGGAAGYVGSLMATKKMSLVGVVFVLSLAVGFLITPQEELLDALFGNISTVALSDAIAAVFISIVVFIAARMIYSKMMLAYVSEDLALASGVKINKYNLIYLFLIAAVVAFGIKVGGTLLTSAMIIVPAAVARNVSRNMRQYSWLSVIVGIASAIAGFAVFPFLAARFGLSVVAIGPIIILASIVFFAVSLLFKKR